MEQPDQFAQPIPSKGRVSVTAVVRQRFNDLLTLREKIGISRYGTTLQTHNGRDAFTDALDEQIDGFQYLIQGLIEHQDALALLEVYRRLIGRLYMLDESSRERILDETIDDPFISPQTPVTVRQLVTRYCQQCYEGAIDPAGPGSGDTAQESKDPNG